MTTTAMASMDDHRIGPGGQTFGQLKADVVSCRQAFLASLVGTDVTPREGGELLRAYEGAVDLLRAAYVRVGLPYQTP